MPKINLSYSAALSLTVNSSAGSEEEEVEEVETEETSALEMSDEEFEKMSESDFEEESEEEDLGNETEEESEEEANEEEPTDTAVESGSEQAEEEEETTEDQPRTESDEAEVGQDEQAINDAFELLYGSPIKASGREVTLRNPEHADRFIKMGIDYNKKMQSMKPHLGTLKTLEKRGLLADDKVERLNLLLEAESGNKDALKRLIAESEIDPMDLADEDVIEEGKNYRPQNHMMTPNQVEIDEALNSIEGTQGQDRTLNIMTNEMDQKSREVISDNPSYIKSLNDDIESGIYDKVMEGVNYKRDMNMVNPGTSDIELYIDTVREMAEYEVSQQQQNQPAQQKASSKQNKVSRRKKLGMSGNKSSKTAKKKEYDPMDILSMDDEKFMKEMGMDNL